MVTSQNVIQTLAQGYLPPNRTQLFFALAKTIVVDISGRNDSDSTQTFNILTKIGGISMGRTPVNCSLPSRYSFDKILNNPILLMPGDSIDGDCLNDKSISFEIVGIKDV